MFYLVAIQHPHDFDPSKEHEGVGRDVKALNDEMKAANVRVFRGGLLPIAEAKSLRPQTNGEVLITDGPYLETKEYVGGFWVLETNSIEEALEWGRKAALACRVPVEVREFGRAGVDK